MDPETFLLGEGGWPKSSLKCSERLAEIQESYHVLCRFSVFGGGAVPQISKWICFRIKTLKLRFRNDIFFGLSKELGLKSVHPARQIYIHLCLIFPFWKGWFWRRILPTWPLILANIWRTNPPWTLKKFDRKRNVFIFPIAQLFA